MTEKKVQAGIYCRISLASIGDTTKTDDQQRICRELAARLGWEVADVYSDDNKSAWQPNRKRPQWKRMLGDVEAGKINAIVVYHGDRLLRTHEDLLALINLARTRGVKLASPAGTRDLGSYDDQFILEIEASMAKRESANTSRRRKQQYERWRREGKVRSGGRGGRAFGFDTKGEVLGDDRCVIATRELTGEPRIVREIAARVLAGESLGQIARDLTGRGWRTPAGRPFTHGTIRKMLARPRYAGLMPDGASKAAWEPILERADWETAAAVLGARASGFGSATNARKYLLSGIARCGIPGCGATMQIWQSKGRAGSYVLGYRCSGCRRLFRSQPLLDAFVAEAVVAQLARGDNPEGRAPETPGLAAQFAALTEAQRELEEVLADPARGKIPALLERWDRLDKRLAELRALAGDDARARLRAGHAGISYEEFMGEPLPVRRSLADACFSIVVLPASKRGPGFRAEDVRLTPR